ncbi:hypothetical protein [Cryptosporangium phraense]|uniref:Uncharacterized protein n=1 Tax=Cryptosporangium phraense TaxID=2593070 RepID=A0A545AHX7_9ACTN|nr:hypothetical protein [Cryptosporangium phraense]TQS40922.1 hypothetical protein FL583_32380 [Cryptosporangium phraense]
MQDAHRSPNEVTQQCGIEYSAGREPFDSHFGEDFGGYLVGENSHFHRYSGVAPFDRDTADPRGQAGQRRIGHHVVQRKVNGSGHFRVDVRDDVVGKRIHQRNARTHRIEDAIGDQVQIRAQRGQDVGQTSVPLIHWYD